MFYLEKVISIIGNVTCRESVAILGEILQKQGLAFVDVSESVFALNCAGSVENLMKQEELLKSAVLFVTDDASCVKLLRQEGWPVLAILHEDNRAQDLSGALYACEEPQELDADYMDRVFRRYMRIPWDVLQTERCFIRETVPEDVPFFYKIYSAPSVTQYTEGLYPEIEQEKKYINDYIDNVYSFYNFGVWTIIKDDTDEIIGRAGFSYREGYEEPEIGFVIGVPWQRQGYAEEVCRAVLKYGYEELGFTEVQALVKPDNQASVALCRKLGFELKQEVPVNGERLLRFMKKPD